MYLEASYKSVLTLVIIARKVLVYQDLVAFYSYNNLIGECNTILSAYTLYRHLE